MIVVPLQVVVGILPLHPHILNRSGIWHSAGSTWISEREIDLATTLLKVYLGREIRRWLARYTPVGKSAGGREYVVNLG